VNKAVFDMEFSAGTKERSSVGRKCIPVLLFLVGVFHLVWFCASRLYQRRKLPDADVLERNLSAMMQRLRISIDRKVVEETYIEANGYRLHLTILPCGPDAATVVLIPGSTSYAQLYFQFMYNLYRQGFTVMGFDPRGHGQSSGARGDYTINGIVDDALAVVEYARKRFGGQIVLAGHSQGGLAAFYAAARDESIAAAVCYSIADLNGRDNLVLSHIRPPHFLIPVCEFLMNLYASYSIPIAFYLDLRGDRFIDGTDVATHVRLDRLAVGWYTFRGLNSLMHTDMPKPVEKITVPIMLVHAENDRIFPQKYVEGIYNRLTCRKNYLLLKGREHLAIFNNVDEFVPPVAAWLKEVLQ